MSEQPMRVVIVTMQLPVPSEAFALGQIRAILRQGVSVEVAALRPEHTRARELMEDAGLDVPRSHLTAGGWLRGLWFSCRRPRLAAWSFVWVVRAALTSPRQRLDLLFAGIVLVPRALEILGRLERDPPAVVHLYWGHLPSLVGGLVHRCLPQVGLSLGLGAYDLRMRYGGSRWMVERADAITTYARINLDALEELGAPLERVEVIYHGVEVPREASEPQPWQPPLRLLCAARLIPLKRVDRVLDLCAELHELAKVDLVICGDGPEREALQQEIHARGLEGVVELAGHVPQSRLFAHMEEADVTVLLSETERIPNVLKEAMLRRCLVVTSVTPGIEELVRDGETGLVVAPGETTATLARRLLATWTNEPERERLLTGAIKHVRAYFDIDGTIGELVRVWRELRVPGSRE